MNKLEFMKKFKVKSTHIGEGRFKIKVATRKETLGLVYNKIKEDHPKEVFMIIWR